MGYLDNSSVTVDAILTLKGRELLAKGGDAFKITQFALGDDEIDYSLWNPKARNGSHYGLGQMRSTWYRDLSPQAQIRASIKYIRHRYDDSCKALHHFETKGWH